MIASSLLEIAEDNLESAHFYTCVLIGGELVHPENAEKYLQKSVEFAAEAHRILAGQATENVGNITDVEGIEDEEPVEMVDEEFEDLSLPPPGEESK